MINRLSQLDFADLWTFVVFPLFPLSCWIIYLFLAWRKNSVLSLDDRKEVPWGAIDVALVMGSMMLAKFLSQVCSIFLIAWKTGLPPEKINIEIATENAGILVGTGIVFSLLQLGLAVWYLKNIQGSTWEDLGIYRGAFKKHLATGAVAALMVIPVVLIVNILLHVFLKAEYSHQVMTMVRYSLWITAASTILVAPLVEEFHFRVVLQGFLQRLHDLSLEKKVQIIQGDQRARKILDLDSHKKHSDRRKKIEPKPSQSKVPLWPILISAFFFASVHMGQGAAPYALFLLALFLGFLYRQTNSILPSILVHLLLNLWSFLALVYSLD